MVGPGRHGPADFVEEVFEHLLPARCVPHLGVELNAVDALLSVLHRCHRRAFGRRHAQIAVGCLGDRVTVAHPHVLCLGELVEEPRPIGDLQRRLPVLGCPGLLNGAAGGVGDHLMPVTDTQNRNPEIEETGVDAVGVLGIHRGRTA